MQSSRFCQSLAHTPHIHLTTAHDGGACNATPVGARRGGSGGRDCNAGAADNEWLVIVIFFGHCKWRSKRSGAARCAPPGRGASDILWLWLWLRLLLLVLLL